MSIGVYRKSSRRYFRPRVRTRLVHTRPSVPTEFWTIAARTTEWSSEPRSTEWTSPQRKTEWTGEDR